MSSNRDRSSDVRQGSSAKPYTVHRASSHLTLSSCGHIQLQEAVQDKATPQTGLCYCGRLSKLSTKQRFALLQISDGPGRQTAVRFDKNHIVTFILPWETLKGRRRGHSCAGSDNVDWQDQAVGVWTRCDSCRRRSRTREWNVAFNEMRETSLCDGIAQSI